MHFEPSKSSDSHNSAACLCSSLSAPKICRKPSETSLNESTPSPFVSMRRNTSWMSRRWWWSSCRATALMHMRSKVDAALNWRMFFSTMVDSSSSAAEVAALDWVSQGCTITLLMDKRFVGSAFSNTRMKSFAFGFILSHGEAFMGYLSARALKSWCDWVPQKGGLPHSMTYVSTPRLQRSQAAVYSYLFSDMMTSGAAYWKLPTAEVMEAPRNAVASPQSINFTRMSEGSVEQKTTFSGLRSRCAIPRP
mmetsp:Transcript_27202/g.56433  ORF Transcript_27202/g.56433 Transcript_27202/m.56433 type:complete len:250 (+) Transcript_27202:647-1396(+)